MRESQNVWGTEKKRQTQMRRKIFAGTTKHMMILLFIPPVSSPLDFPLFSLLNRSAIKSSANKQINFVMAGR